jgi:hypothetical protein
MRPLQDGQRALHQKIYEVKVIGYCKAAWYPAQTASSSAAYGVEKRANSVPGEYARKLRAHDVKFDMRAVLIPRTAAVITQRRLVPTRRLLRAQPAVELNAATGQSIPSPRGRVRLATVGRTRAAGSAGAGTARAAGRSPTRRRA